MTFADRFPLAATNPAVLDAALTSMIDIAGAQCSADVYEYVCGAVWGIRFMHSMMERGAHGAAYDAAVALWTDQELGSE